MLHIGTATVRHVSGAWMKLGRFGLLPMCVILAGAAEAPAAIVVAIVFLFLQD